MLGRVHVTRVLQQQTNCIASSRVHSRAFQHVIRHHNRNASTSAIPITVNAADPDVRYFAKGKERKENGPTVHDDKELKEAAKMFEDVGLNSRLSLQLVTAFPAIRSPTSAQQVLLSVISKENDIMLRAHTGTGKSLAILLGLLNKPRLIVQEERGKTSSKSKRITSIIIVPSSELAIQYEGWVKQLFPKEMHHKVPSVVAVKYRDPGMSNKERRDRKTVVEEDLKQLIKDPPHILVVTATHLDDMLTLPQGPSILGISTLRTLVLDEVDSLLGLPGRFPSSKVMWKFEHHPSPGLRAVNFIMKGRSTHSGGAAIPNAGLEVGNTGITSDMRRRIHQGNDMARRKRESLNKNGFRLNVAKEEWYRGEKPLQLVTVSATANATLRNFFGAKTGWMRTGLRNRGNGESGKWLDLTGMSPGVNKGTEVAGLVEKTQSGWGLQLPKELKHSCIVVDEPTGDGQLSNYRLLNPSQARSGKLDGAMEEDREKKDYDSQKDKFDSYKELLTCLAYLFATQPVTRAIAFIPAQWSLFKTKQFLHELEIPARFVSEVGDVPLEGEGSQVLYLLQAPSARGLDFPGALSHVFCLGIESVENAVNYVHLAGRASRIGHDGKGGHERIDGHVITLLRGLSVSHAKKNQEAGKMLLLANAEMKMSVIYKRLGIRAEKIINLGNIEIQNVMEEEEGDNDDDDEKDVAAEEEAEEMVEAEDKTLESSIPSNTVNHKD